MMTSHACRRNRPGQGLARLICLAAISALSFSSATAGAAQLHLESVPAGANVSIDGASCGSTPLTLSSLPAGKHLLLVEKRDYNPSRETVVLGEGEAATREFRLEPIQGLILIHSTPSGAEVEVEGAHRGTTPTLISDLTLGRYRAKLVKPGYITKEIEMTIASRSPVKFDVTLTSDSATLAINSEPPGAAVTLNGVARGQTPCTVDRIPSGSTTLALALPGFEPYSEKLNLAAGESPTITATLKAIPSDLTIVSIPPAARIYVDNQFRGKAPVTLAGIAPGTYRVRAEMEAHDVLARDLDIGRAQNVVEEFRLLRNAGSLEITTEPAGVSILLDGKDVGTTPADTNRTDRVSERLRIDLVPCGAHVVTLTKVGFHESKDEVNIVRDETLTRHYRLKRRFIPNYEVKTEGEVYRGILVEVDAQKNIKLEINPGIFKTLMREEIKAIKRTQPVWAMMWNPSKEEKVP